MHCLLPSIFPWPLLVHSEVLLSCLSYNLPERCSKLALPVPLELYFIQDEGLRQRKRNVVKHLMTAIYSNGVASDCFQLCDCSVCVNVCIYFETLGNMISAEPSIKLIWCWLSCFQSCSRFGRRSNKQHGIAWLMPHFHKAGNKKLIWGIYISKDLLAHKLTINMWSSIWH